MSPFRNFLKRIDTPEARAAYEIRKTGRFGPIINVVPLIIDNEHDLRNAQMYHFALEAGAKEMKLPMRYKFPIENFTISGPMRQCDLIRLYDQITSSKLEIIHVPGIIVPTPLRSLEDGGFSLVTGLARLANHNHPLDTPTDVLALSESLRLQLQIESLNHPYLRVFPLEKSAEHSGAATLPQRYGARMKLHTMTKRSSESAAASLARQYLSHLLNGALTEKVNASNAENSAAQSQSASAQSGVQA